MGLDGICSPTVVGLRFEDERTWAATRLPAVEDGFAYVWNSSTVRAVLRAHSFSRSSVNGTE